MKYCIKITRLLLCLTVLAVCSCSEKGNLLLNGTVEGVSSGKVYLQKFENKAYKLIDSAEIKNGKFRFSRNVELPEIYTLTLNPEKGNFFMFLDENPVTVKLDSARYYQNSEIKGSKLHDAYDAYIHNNGEVKIDEYIKENPSSLVAAYALYRHYAYRLSPEEIRSNIKLLDSTLWNTQYVKVLNEFVIVLESVAIGKPAPDFTLNDTLGKPVKFSEYTKKGYLLLDFWASWCGPCRAENPNIVKIYNKYKDKGFDIFAVSLDASKEAWLTAIAKDRLTWLHVSDLAGWGSQAAKLYGVRAIPANCLIDKDGKIMAKNLRGEDLEKTLEEIFK